MYPRAGVRPGKQNTFGQRPARVTISLEGISHMRPIVRTGKVSWSVTTADGDCCVGISLEKYLAYQDIRHLT